LIKLAKNMVKIKRKKNKIKIQKPLAHEINGYASSGQSPFKTPSPILFLFQDSIVLQKFTKKAKKKNSSKILKQSPNIF